MLLKFGAPCLCPLDFSLRVPVERKTKPERTQHACKFIPVARRNAFPGACIVVYPLPIEQTCRGVPGLRIPTFANLGDLYIFRGVFPLSSISII